MTGDQFFMDLLTGTSCPEPPLSVPLRILGLAERPGGHDAVKVAFRAAVKRSHPDIADIVPDSALLAPAMPAGVEELMWARDVLLRKIPVTAENITTAHNSNRNGDDTAPKVYEPSRCRVCDVAGKAMSWRGRWAGHCWRCAQEAENERQRERRRQCRADRRCRICGETFTPPRSDGLFCSSACRQRAYRQRRGGEAS